MSSDNINHLAKELNWPKRPINKVTVGAAADRYDGGCLRPFFIRHKSSIDYNILIFTCVSFQQLE